MHRKIPYTGGGNDRPYTAPFKIKFKKALDKHKIDAGDESLTYIVPMTKNPGIMAFPPYGVKDFYMVFQTEDDLLDMFEFVELTEYNKTPKSVNPPEESGTDVILPY